MKSLVQINPLEIAVLGDPAFGKAVEEKLIQIAQLGAEAQIYRQLKPLELDMP